MNALAVGREEAPNRVRTRPEGSGKGIVICAGGWAPVGGIETFIFDLATGLAARGLLTAVTCWGKRSALLSDIERSGVTTCRLGWRWGCRWSWPDRLMMRCAWRQLRNSDVLVFGKLLHPSIHHRLAKSEKRMILITPYRPTEMWAGRRPDDATLNSFASIIVQTPEFADDLRSFGYQRRVVVLPYIPPATGPVAPWPPESPVRVGFLGRMVPDKNVGALLLAVSAARRAGLNMELHLFGDGAELRNLQSEAERLGLAGGAFFHGNSARSELASAIDSCHLFAFTSRREGQCLAALEILARGRPVVAVPVGAFPGFLSDGQLGALAVPDEPDEFARALAAVARGVGDSTFTPDGVQAAYSQRFPREQVIQEYIDLLLDRAGPE